MTTLVAKNIAMIVNTRESVDYYSMLLAQEKAYLNPTPIAEIQTAPKTDFTVDVNGDAFISQRKVAELCGVARNSIVHFFKDKGDINQGISSDQLAFVVQHYAQQSKPEAVNTLILFSQAGAKAYIYHQAGFTLKAEKAPAPKTALELAKEQVELLIQIEEKDKLLKVISLARTPMSIPSTA